MKTISLSDKQIHGKGSFGVYFRLSQRTGVKIIKGTGRKQLPDLKSVKIQKVIQEAAIGILAEGPTKKLVWAKYKGLTYVGILQKHITTVKTNNITFNLKKYKDDLIKKHIVYGDLHKKNVLVAPKAYVLIDFDPDTSYYVGSKQVYYTVKNKLVKDLKNN
jgi:hypothetical protein